MAQDPGQGKEQKPKSDSRIDNRPVSVNGGNDEESIDSVPLYRNFKLVIPLFVILLGLAIVAYYWYMGTREYVTTDDAYVDANRVSVSSKILGRITNLAVDEGDSVRSGQVLVNLDDTSLRADETQAQAALALATENVTLTKVNLDKAQMDFDRASTQFKDNVITKEQFDHAESELQASKSRYNIAIAQTKTARAQIGVVETQLANTIISSPMNGVVSKRWVLKGDVVSAGQPIFTLYDLKNLWVTANLEETSIEALRSADKVEITVDAYPDQKFIGKVFQIGSNTASQFSLIPPNNASGNFTKITQRVPVKISIQPTSDLGTSKVQLLPGMSVEVKVKVQ